MRSFFAPPFLKRGRGASPPTTIQSIPTMRLMLLEPLQQGRFSIVIFDLDIARKP